MSRVWVYGWEPESPCQEKGHREQALSQERIRPGKCGIIITQVWLLSILMCKRFFFFEELMGREVGVVITDGNPAGHPCGTSEKSLRSGLNSVLGFWVQYPGFLCPAGDRFMLVVACCCCCCCCCYISTGQCCLLSLSLSFFFFLAFLFYCL